MYHDINLVIRVLKEFYINGRTQAEIADKEHISKSTVSRILKKAKDDGLVTFDLHLPLPSLYDLEQEFKELFKLQKVCITPTYMTDIESRFLDVIKILAVDLNKIIQDGDTIGLCWGKAMTLLSLNLVPCNPIKHNLRIVQLSGSLAKHLRSLKSYSIIENFSKNYLCDAHILPVPTIVDSIELKNALSNDTQVKEVLDIGESARIAIFGIGDLSPDSMVFKTGTLSPTYYDCLTSKGAVSDVITHFLDIEGNIVDHDLDNRTICLPLKSLMRKEHRIAFTVGEHKAKAIISALNSGAVSSFYTDESTARQVIEEHKKIFGS